MFSTTEYTRNRGFDVNLATSPPPSIHRWATVGHPWDHLCLPVSWGILSLFVDRRVNLRTV